jgi:23S rRNA (uridine2552-2'-O)-methyltransferase
MAKYEKPDFWSLKAQKEGYPARSVYKLMEIDEKFNFFKSARQAGKPNSGSLRVLDLGAAPGSWSLYVLRKYGTTSKNLKGFFLAAADLLPLPENPELQNRKDFFFIQADFTGSLARNELARHGPYNAIICDAAPPTTGSRTVDTQRSLTLAEEAISLAISGADNSSSQVYLTPGGNLAVKVFQGGGTADLLKHLREFFTSVKSFKPEACRSSSFETYLLGIGKR